MAPTNYLEGLGNPDAGLTAALNNLQLPVVDYSNTPAAIASLRAWMRTWEDKEPKPGVTETFHYMTARDGYKLRLCVFSHNSDVTWKTKPHSRPLIVIYHGGGWTIGSPECESTVCRMLAEQFGAVCVAPQYRLAPEYPFPFGINDAWDSLQWIAANSTSILNATPLTDGFIVGGFSAGANFAAVLSHLARDKRLTPPLTGVYLAAPSILPPPVVPDRYRGSYLSQYQETCRNSSLLSIEMRNLFRRGLKPDIQSCLFVPFNWPTGHEDLPPTYMQVCGLDVVRDEGLIYEQVLREECAIQTRLDVYPGLPHVFWSYFPTLPQTQKMRKDTLEGFSWIFALTKAKI